MKKVILVVALLLFSASWANAQTRVMVKKDFSAISLNNQRIAPMENGVARWSRKSGNLATQVDVLFLTPEALKRFEEIGIRILWNHGPTEAPLYYFIGNSKTGLVIPIQLSQTNGWLEGKIDFE